MLEIRQVEDIPANHRMTIELLYYSSMRDLKHIEHKFHQIVSRFKAEHQKVIELEQKLKARKEEDEIDRLLVEVID